MINKKKLLIISVLGTVIFLVSLFPEKIGICSAIDTSCTRLFDETGETFLVFIPLFLLSLLTYKMRDEVYRAWVRFAYIWIPLSMIAVFLAPEYTHDWMLPVEKGSVAFFSSAIFVVISLIIIAWKYFATRQNKSL